MIVLIVTLSVLIAYIGVGSLVAVATGRVIREGTKHLDRPLPPESLRGGQTFGVKRGGS